MDAYLVTCEHGGNRIPALCRELFAGQRALLESHRGYDAGALVMARALARAFAAPLVSATVSRLVIDLNRSVGHRELWSAAMRTAPQGLRARIVERHYRPYRAEVLRRAEEAVARGRRVLHISSHSFTPVLDGVVRRADVGLLYDPARRAEAKLCARWKASLARVAPELRVRRNYPYAGKGDGMASTLRGTLPRGAYIGVELEINQAIVFAAGRRFAALRGVLIQALRTASSGAASQ